MEFGNPIVGLEELIRSAIKSGDYEAGVTGWRIARDGSAEFSTIVIRGLGTGDVVIVGPAGSPQVHIGAESTFGYIEFPTNGPVENRVARIIAIRGNSGGVDEYGSMQIDGPSVDGVGATDRILMQLNSQNNDGSSNANWSVSSVVHGALIIADKDTITFGSKTNAPNYPSGAWTAFTPSWSTSTGAATPSFGNASLNCDWTRHGRTITARYEIVFGSTTNFGGGASGDNWRFGLPVTSSATHQVNGFFELNSSTSARCVARSRFTVTGSTELEISSGRPDAVAITNLGLIDAVSPWTWANGDAIRGQITYEAAS